MRGSANGLESGEKRERAKGARGAPAVVPRKEKDPFFTGDPGRKKVLRRSKKQRRERAPTENRILNKK
jgi:hypothetical protein